MSESNTVAVLGIVATLIGVGVATLAWLSPFNPVGSSPLSPSTSSGSYYPPPETPSARREPSETPSSSSGPTNTISAVVAPTPSPQPLPTPRLQITIRDRLGNPRDIDEEVRVWIGGIYMGSINLNSTSPEGALAVSLPAPGRYDTILQSVTHFDNGGTIGEWRGDGRGTITVQQNGNFYIFSDFSRVPAILTLAPGP